MDWNKKVAKLQGVTLVGYGIGQYYESVKNNIPKELKLSYLCDARYADYGQEYDGIRVISPTELSKLKEVTVLIFAGNVRAYASMSSMLDDMGLSYLHAQDVIPSSYAITGKELKEGGYDGHYTDVLGNEIYYPADMENSIRIHFGGGGNVLHFGARMSVESLDIRCGKNGYVSIGDGTEIEQAKLFVTDGKIEIGSDCLFSYEVFVRNHDYHHIFDSITGQRINYPKDITIGNHVWLGYGVTLLGGAAIADNSIVGSQAVTSSAFGKEVVLAGNPAKVIREHVCWSKDNTEFFSRDNLDECLAKEAKKYL